MICRHLVTVPDRHLELVLADVALHAVQLDDDVQLVHVAGAVRQADLRVDVGRLLALALLAVLALCLQTCMSSERPAAGLEAAMVRSPI